MDDLAGKGDLRTVATGLFPQGFDVAALTPEGRDEVRAAVDAILRLWDQENARLSLALKQLDKGAAEIERLKGANDKIGSWLSAALEDQQVCEEMKIAVREWFAAQQP